MFYHMFRAKYLLFFFFFQEKLLSCFVIVSKIDMIEEIYIFYSYLLPLYMKKLFLLAGFSLLLAGCSDTAETIPLSEKVPTTAEGTLGKCLAQKGAIMYGTSWCGHCQEQKKAFGTESKDFLPFIDCDENKGICSKAGIKGYPTWKFADNSELVGNRSLEELAAKTSCEYTK